jgi:2-polyprenyl-6-methoxyphenol hydroxylase-like FAD-dependent oxidoreductase
MRFSRLGRTGGSDHDLLPANQYLGSNCAMAHRRITVLGDAIHSMTPYRGIGANVAIKDAAHLKHALVSAHRAERDLADVIHDYQTAMLNYGFRAVPNSLKVIHRTVTDSLSALMMTRLTIRAINALSPVKRVVASRLGEE